MSRLARSLPLLAVLVAAAPPLRAQQPSMPRREGEPLASTYDPEFLHDLPTNDNLFTILDTLQPSVVPDRIAAGGLFVGQPARVGGFLSSGTQTTYQLDGVPFTDPTGNGAPLLVPDLFSLGTVRFSTGAYGADTGAGGLAVDLSPPAHGDRWRRTIEGAFAHGWLLAAGNRQPPPGDVVDGFDRGGISGSGPVADRVHASFSVSAARNGQLSAADQFPIDSFVQAASGSVIFTPNPTDTVRILGLVQRRKQPLDQRFALRRPLATLKVRGEHGQFSWDCRPADGAAFRFWASITQRRDAPRYDSATGAATVSSGIADRLLDGPIPQFGALSVRDVGAWSLGARVAPESAGVHHVVAGGDLQGGQLSSSAFFTGAIGELVHGVPARVWQFNVPATSSERHVTTIDGYAADRMTLSPRLTIEAGVRAESLRGSADGAQQGVSWLSILPHASAQVAFSEGGRLAAFGSYSRAGARLSLDDLALGDPSAPYADVYRWTTLAGYPLSLSDRGPRVARVGPGTGGDPRFTSIDPELKRPVSDEVVVGIQGQTGNGVFLRLAAVARQERHLSGLVDSGAPTATSYTTFSVQDPGADALDPEDDRTLTVYNRIPASFAQDRYVWTTPDFSGSTFRGLEFSVQRQSDRLTVTAGGTAGIARTFAANSGYGPLENDQTLVGELFANPNASTLAHGRPFSDRAYTAKGAMVYRFGGDVRLGIVGRYQGGQPFSRVLVFAGLNQGADAVRAFPNGDSHFPFVGTVDGRLQKRFGDGPRSFDLFLDAYNIFNTQNAVEEDVAVRPGVQTPIASQPPRALQVGARLMF